MPNKDISKKIFWLIILAFVLIRLVSVVLLVCDIPPTAFEKGEWWTDEGKNNYFVFGREMTKLNFSHGNDLLGYSLFLSPLIYLTEAEVVKDIAPWVFVIQAFLLFSLSIVLVGLIGKKLFQSRKLGIVCSGLFLIYPYLFYLLFRNLGPFYDGISRGVMSFQSINWIPVASDALAAFLVYLCFFLFLLEFRKGNPRISILILLGILSGFSAQVRIGNILIIGIIVLAFLLMKKVKAGALVGVFSALAFSPQLIYNYIFMGSITRFPFYEPSLVAGKIVVADANFDLTNWLHFFKMIYIDFPIVMYAVPFSIIFLVLGIKFLKEKSRIASMIVVLWLLAFIIFYGSFSAGVRRPRYYLPAVPPAIYLVVSSLAYIQSTIKKDEKL